MSPLAVSAKIIALRESLPSEAAAWVVPAGEMRVAREAPPLPTRIAGLDSLLGGGLARGKLVEIVGRRSSGRFAVALCSLASATGSGENAALVDLGGGLDPENAGAADIDLRRLLWIRPWTLQDAVYAAEVAIATGFSLVVADLGMAPVGRRVPEAAWVRLARSARAHSTALLVATPYPVAGTAADAAIHLGRDRALWSGRGASPRLLVGVASRSIVEKKRGERPGRAAETRFPMGDAIERPGAPAKLAGPSAGFRSATR